VSGSSGTFDGIRIDANSAITSTPGSPYHLPTGNAVSLASAGTVLFVDAETQDEKGDTVSSYRADPVGKLALLTTTAVQGGTQIVADAAGKFLYVSAMVGLAGQSFNSAAIYGFSINQGDGSLSAISGSPWTLPGLEGIGTIKVSPNGALLCAVAYLSAASNVLQCYSREPNGSINPADFVQLAQNRQSIGGLTFTVDGTHVIYTAGNTLISTPIAISATGTITSLPGAFALGVATDITANWLAVAETDSGNIQLFQLQADGSVAGASTVAAQDVTHLSFSKSNAYLFASSRHGTFVFSFDPKTGAMKPLNATNPAPGSDGPIVPM
jgi:6-phosphogluconolactonase (cycloisomerase 2 family)